MNLGWPKYVKQKQHQEHAFRVNGNMGRAEENKDEQG